MKFKILFIFALASHLVGLAQIASVEIVGNTTPTVNSTVTYTAVFRNSNGSVIPNPSGTGGFVLIAGHLGSVTTSDLYSITVNWTDIGSGTIEFGFNGSGYSTFQEVYVDVLPGAAPPTPVANNGSSPTTTSFVASWTTSTGATSYTLELSLSSNFGSVFRTYSGLINTTLSITNLTPGTTYHYRVRAYLNANPSNYSNTGSGMTVPNAPTVLTTTSVTQTTFNASWAPTTGAFRYELDVSADEFASYVTGYDGLIVTGTSATVSGLLANTTYKWRVRAVNSQYSESVHSTVQTLTTLLPTLPPPTLTGISNTTSNGFKLTWDAVTGATGYRVDLSMDQSFGSFVGPYENFLVNGVFLEFGNLTPNTIYHARVRSINATQTSESSSVVSKLTICAVPEATQASDATSTSFKANWNGVVGATSYEVDFATNENFSPILSTVVGIVTNSHTLTGIAERTTYYYRVRAINPSGKSNSSNTVRALNFDHNYIRSTEILVENVTTLAAVQGLSVNQRFITAEYFDGLGRPVQSVMSNQSSSEKDIIIPFAYDKYGRETGKFLPYVDPMEDNGHFKENALKNIAASGSEEDRYRTGRHYQFYQNGGVVASDQYPYSTTRFEPSPMMRVLEQGGPGATWQPDQDDNYTSQDHTVKLSYEFNSTDEVVMWSYVIPDQNNPNGSITSSPQGTPVYYEPYQLFRNRTRDENGREVIEYTDKQGRVILKKVQAVENASLNNDDHWAQTYYIYDDFGNLVVVLPPEAVKALISQ